jgi:hypothetical protein
MPSGLIKDRNAGSNWLLMDKERMAYKRICLWSEQLNCQLGALENGLQRAKIAYANPRPVSLLDFSVQ